jgi:hypothetical protein
VKTNHERFAKINAEVAGIPKDEPVFLLRAQDQHAAAAVRFYAGQVAAANGDPAIIASATQAAVDFDAWPKKKAPDVAEHPAKKSTKKDDDDEPAADSKKKKA